MAALALLLPYLHCFDNAMFPPKLVEEEKRNGSGDEEGAPLSW